jgi:carboxypeptidase Taq
MTPQEAYEQLLKSLRQIAVVDSTVAVLAWDERVNLRPKGTEARAEQLSTLSRMQHEMFTSPRIGELMSTLEQSELVKQRYSDVEVNVRETRRAYDRATKLPGSLVEEMARTSSLGEAAWAEARKKSDFAMFQPWLTKQIDLSDSRPSATVTPRTSTMRCWKTMSRTPAPKT